MKNRFLIIIILLGITSSNTNFLRQLEVVTVTLKSVTFPTYCADNMVSGYKFSLALTVPNEKSISQTKTDKFKLVEKGTPAKEIATSCSIEAKTGAGDATVSCTTSAAGTAGKTYQLFTPDNTVVITTDVLEVTKWDAKAEEVAKNPNYVALGTQTTEQTFDYKEEGNKAFTIKFASALIDAKKPKAVKAGETTITGCTIDTTDSTIYSCPITKTTVPVVNKTETSYVIKITDACDQEANTGITVKVKDTSSTPSSSSFFNQMSIFAVIVFGMLLY